MTFSNRSFRTTASFLNQFIRVGFSGMIILLYGMVFILDPLKVSQHNADDKKDLLSSTFVEEVSFKNLPSSPYEINSICGAKDLEYPRFSPIRFSAQLVQVRDIHSRKKTFVDNLLPAILASNEEIKADRHYILMLKKAKDNGQPLTSKQQEWLRQLARRYKLQQVKIAELLKRVDVIPPSLALGQAVVETGWGGSIAAQRLNSPFGMMKSRDRGFSYSNLQESVGHYIHNLNTHDAYTKMRTIRSNSRHAGETLCSLQLAEGLIHYSELGKTYVSRVKNIIHSFNLRHYDQASRAKLPINQRS